MSKDKIIIKASDYWYPPEKNFGKYIQERPIYQNFGYVSESLITSILRDKRSLTEVHRDDNLEYWNHILLNKNGALAHSFNLTMVISARDIHDHVEQFERIHYINRIQFDHYAEAYYHFATVKDTMAQLLNIYFFLGLEVNKIHFNARFVKSISSIEVLVAINISLTKQLWPQNTEIVLLLGHRYILLIQEALSKWKMERQILHLHKILSITTP